MKAKLLNTLPLIALLALGVGWLPLSGLLSLASDEVTASAYLRDRGVWGMLLLALGQLLQVAIAVIPGNVFTILGGYVYGFSSGLAINLGRYRRGQSTHLCPGAMGWLASRWCTASCQPVC